MGCDFAPAKSEGRGNGHLGAVAVHRRCLETARGARRGSAFDAGHGHGFDELLLDDEVEEGYGEGDDGRGGHDGVPALFGEGVIAGEGDGEGGELVAADNEEGPEEGVPGPVEVDDDCGEQEGAGDGKGDLVKQQTHIRRRSGLARTCPVFMPQCLMLQYLLQAKSLGCRPPEDRVFSSNMCPGIRSTVSSQNSRKIG